MEQPMYVKTQNDHKTHNFFVLILDRPKKQKNKKMTYIVAENAATLEIQKRTKLHLTLHYHGGE